MRWLAALALMTLPAGADPLGLVDYDAVIAAHVEAGAATSRITLEGGVVLTLDAEGALIDARDPGDALGCLANGLAELSAAARICPGALSPGGADAVDTAIARLIPVYAAGVRPDSTDVATAAERFEALVRTRMGDVLICGLTDHALFLRQFLRTPEGQLWLDNALATPRLPVSDPCF